MEDIIQMTSSLNQNPILASDIYGLTGEEFSNGRDNLTVVRKMLESGIQIIQYREKEKKTGEKYAECLKIREMTRDYGATFIVNDDVDLALMTHADGIHVGQKDFPITAIRQLVGNRMFIGLSTHAPEEAHDAVKQGVDYIGVGPIYLTYTKKDVCEPVGLEYLDYVVQHIDLPFVVIGGIKQANVAEVIQHGARCVAMITEIVGADNIAEKVQAIRREIKQAQNA
jgi:thiamine-phosphate pyrophosphorylase